MKKSVSFLSQIEGSSFQSEPFYLMDMDRKIAEFSVVGKGVLEKIRIDRVFTEIPEWIEDSGSFRIIWLVF